MEERTICFNCGRYVGAKDRCPYCGEEQLKPIGIEFLKWTSLIVAISGVFFLFISARTQEAPLVKVIDLKPTMNFAKVKMQGVVKSSPYYDEEKGGYLSFWLDDGTGNIKVRAFKNVAKEIIDKNMYPTIGDSVSLKGTLYIKENFLITIEKSEDLKIKIPKHINVKIKEITDTLIGKRVETEGTIYSVNEYKNKSIGIRIGDLGSFITVFIPNYYKEKEKILGLERGTKIKVRGAVFVYKDNLEIIPHYVDEILVIGKEEIKISKKRETTKIKGEVLEGSTFKKSIKLKIKTEEGIEEVLLWKSLLEKKYKNEIIKILTGSMIEFEVYEREYKGKKEKNVSSLRVISYPEKVTKISDILNRNIGEFLKTEGKVEEIKEFEKGTRVIIKDETGELIVWIWKDIWDKVKGTFGEGDSIRVIGELKEFRGKKEIIPRVHYDIIPIK
ncbi:MAG: OB-fold nucleic acid binding domain-containing protein [Candidatus Hydrothermales bacterium]